MNSYLTVDWPIESANQRKLSNQELKNMVAFHETVFNEIFSDVAPGSVISGPTEVFNLTIENLRGMNFGIYATPLYTRISDIINAQGFNPHSKIMVKSIILDCAYNILSSANIQNIYSPAISNIFTVTNRDRRSREVKDIVRQYDLLAKRYGKIAINDYNIQFRYKSRTITDNPEEAPIFIDSEGLCLPLYHLDDEDKTLIGEQEGIYVLKSTVESTSREFTVLPLPIEGVCTKSELLNGVFFSSYKEFKEVYKRESKTEYDTSSEDTKIFNIKKLVGKYLFNGVTQTSHGLVSLIVGISLSRKSFYTCSHEYGVSEIINITPECMSDVEFQNVMNEYGISRDVLQTHDIIIRRTNIGPGSGKAISRNIKYEKIKINRRTGLNEIKDSIMDSDLQLFNETGLGIFTTAAAAERCLKHGGGDIEKYIQYIASKTTSKSEKSVIMDSVKNALLVGAGAAIPKLVDHIISKTKRKVVENVIVSHLMKPMLPPMFKTMGVVGLGVISGGQSLLVNVGLIIIKGVKIMGFISGIKSFFSGFSGGNVVTTVTSVFGKIVDFIKSIGIKAWEILKATAGGIKYVFDLIFNGDYSISEKFKILFDGAKGTVFNIFNFAKDLVMKGVDIVKPVVTKIVNTVVDTVKWVWNGLTGFFSGVFA